MRLQLRINIHAHTRRLRRLVYSASRFRYLCVNCEVIDRLTRRHRRRARSQETRSIKRKPRGNIPPVLSACNWKLRNELTEKPVREKGMLYYVQNTRGSRGARIKALLKKEGCLTVHNDTTTNHPPLRNHAVRYCELWRNYRKTRFVYIFSG